MTKLTEKNNIAAGPAAGYFYQLERAMLHLATDTKCQKVGVECLDDVVSETASGTILEQNKHSLEPEGNPFTEKSRNLWRTLEIWTDAVDSNSVDLTCAGFFLVTNQITPGESLARAIGDANDLAKALECTQRLRAVTGLSEKVAESAKRVLARSDTDLAEILLRVRLFDGQTRDSVRDDIALGLHIPSDKPKDQILQALYGWTKDCVLAAWEGKRAAWITRDAFERQYHQIIRGLNQQKFRERAESMVPIPPGSEEAAHKRTFVRQLGMIFDEANNQVVITAVKDYLLAVSELTRLYEEGDVTNEQLKAFDESLQGRWRNIFQGHVAQSNPLDAESKVRVGRAVYFETIKHQGSLAGYQTEQPYLTSGTYHKLADDVRVGWHPDHEQLKRNN